MACAACRRDGRTPRRWRASRRRSRVNGSLSSAGAGGVEIFCILSIISIDSETPTKIESDPVGLGIGSHSAARHDRILRHWGGIGMPAPIRVGAVSYLNAKPLYYR